MADEPWAAVLENPGRVLSDSRKSARVPALNAIARHLAEAAANEPLVQAVLDTYNYYTDSASRAAAASAVVALAAADASRLAWLAARLAALAPTTTNMAVPAVLTLLTWTNLLAPLAARQHQDPAHAVLQNILAAQITLLALASGLAAVQAHTHHAAHRRRMLKSSMAQTKLALVHTLAAWAPANAQLYMDACVAAAVGPKTAPSAALLHVALLAEAAHDMLPTTPALHSHLAQEATVAKILAYAASAFVAKPVPEPHALTAFALLFVRNYVSPESFALTLLPALEKAIMRSAETGFCLLAPALFGEKNCIDLSAVFASSKLLTHILSGLKASKEEVRLLAAKTFALVLANAVPDISLADLVLIADNLAKTIKSTSNPDCKALIAAAFAPVTRAAPALATALLLATLTPLVSKELHEPVLASLLSVFVPQLCRAVAAGEAPEFAVAQCIAGLGHLKPALRSIWASAVGTELSAQQSGEHLHAFKEKVVGALQKSFAEATKSPLLAVSNKSIVPAYVYLTLTDDLAAYADADAVLSSTKVLPKLAPQEQEWCLRALQRSPAHTEAHALAIIYLGLSPDMAYTTRLQALDAARLLPPAASGVLVSAVQKAVAGSEPDLAFDLKNLTPFLSVLLLVDDKPTAIQNVVSLFVVPHHPEIPVKDGWIGLLLRAGIDPGAVVKQHARELLTAAYDVMLAADKHSFYFTSACKAISTAFFVDPDTVQPLITDLLRKDLVVSNIQDYDELAIKIYSASEGELVVDPNTPVKTKQVENKNSKDYETRKWEESLKKELSKTATKKLTREEQALVNAQLAKESTQRAEMHAVVKRCIRSLSVVRELSGNKSIVSGGNDWLYVAVFDLLALLQHPSSSALLGSFGAETFIKLSNVCADRLRPLHETTGAVTLRLLQIQGVPENFTDLPLQLALSTVLFRIKLMVDEHFHSNGFVYIMPLITKVLEIGIAVSLKNSKKQAVTSEFSDEDPEEEHLSLALSILSAQDMLQDERMPRIQILESLIALMKIPTKAKMAKECFSTVCQQIAVNFTMPEIEHLMKHLVVPDAFIKTAILQGLDSEFDLNGELSYADQIWIAMHDNDKNVSDLAHTIWSDSNFSLPEDAPRRLLEFANDSHPGLRLTVAKSVASAVMALSPDHPDVYPSTLELLLKQFIEYQIPPPPPKDKFGLVINSHAVPKDVWEPRSTIAITLKLMSPLCNTQQSIEKIFNFLVTDETLGDKETLVAQELLEAGVETIKESGLSFVENLIPIFEKCLAQPDGGLKQQDRIKELVIILYGSLGRHLEKSDARLKIIFDRLLLTLDTPSEDVQYAVSECLAPLVYAYESDLQQLIDDLCEKLWNGKSIAERKGAAYGIAGIVKGSGIKLLFKNDVMKSILAASEERKEGAREGVSFVFECLSQSLGARFEPYVIEVLPIILKFLGDASPQVREATDYAARQIMKATTSYGVKQMIPLAIRNLDDISWRSKKGSVELLGSMAYLDPTQLSASLSTIVPEIVGVLNDTHKEVRKAADQALKRFGEVIRNPEIQAIVPDLIQAIGDPTKYTDHALDKLIKTQFVHYIDGPSLALIIHVIHRGMRERSAATKKKACQIVGNMAILVDSKDLMPYLPSLVSELEVVMVDPVPETRSTGARALGSLVEKLGEEQFPDLIPRLMDTLNDSSKTGDRLGSAQALAEVICGLGLAKLDEMLPSILKNAQSPFTHVRAGFIPLLLYLPVCFGSQFSPYLSRIIPPILQGLADTDEEIRETSLKAGRLLVKNYASKAVDLLLPELEQGLADSLYRIRLSSVELTGDLLFQVTGISGKNEITEEQTEVNKGLVEVLGQERRDRILAALFICRSDVTSVVRAGAIDTWKALVANTPRTIKEIIPSLTQMLVKRLASSDETHRTIAASTLGDVVRRVGANALAQLLPTLQELLATSDSNAKQGICIAITELINSSSSDALNSFQDIFIQIIKDALVEPSPEVRGAAAQAFEALQDRLGKLVIDEILPSLLNMLESGDSQNALLALQDLMATKADVIFPILLPTLMAPPIDVFKTKALSSLASVAGHALYSRLSSIINTLLKAVIDTKKTGTPDELAEVQDAFDKILLSIDSDDGVHPVMQQLMSLIKSQDAEKRAAIYKRLAVFYENTKLDYSVYVSDMVSQLIYYLGDKDQEVVEGVFEALHALVKAQDKQSLERLVKPAHEALTIAGVRGEDLPGFALPKGPSCVLPIFSHGLMYGNSEQKELSALSIAEIIERTPAANLKPFATPITGPLIRVIGEKVAPDIKTAILSALTNLLKRIPQFLRPFIPQLQRTFVRSLSDSNEKLRNGAVEALGLLIKFQPRVDSLVMELVTGAKSAEDKAIKTSMLKAMLQVVLKGGANMSEGSKTLIMTLVEEELNTVDDKSAVAYARLLGSLSQVLSTDEAANILETKVLSKRGDPAELKFAVLAINSFLRDAPIHVFSTGLSDEVVSFIIECAQSSLPFISDNAAVALGKLMLLDGETRSPKQEGGLDSETEFSFSEATKSQLVELLCLAALQPESHSNDTRRLSLVVLRTVARMKHQQFIQPFLTVVATTVFACLRDPIIPIRLAAEKAYLAIFNLVEDTNQDMFSSWFDDVSKSEIKTVLGAVIQPRSIGDYTKRVASRLASVERERLEDGGDDEAMYSDRFEDENEVWAVSGF